MATHSEAPGPGRAAGAHEHERDNLRVAPRWSIPLPLLPDSTLALLRRLRLPRGLARRVRREVELRRGSDRSGPRWPVETAEWLAGRDAE